MNSTPRGPGQRPTNRHPANRKSRGERRPSNPSADPCCGDQTSVNSRDAHQREPEDTIQVGGERYALPDPPDAKPVEGHDPPRLERDPDSPLGKGEDISLQPRAKSLDGKGSGKDELPGPERKPGVARDPMEPQRDDFFPT